MQSDHPAGKKLIRIPLSMRLILISVIWISAISWLHYVFNGTHDTRMVVKMGYMPVITNLAAPLLDYASKDGEGIRYEALKFASFAEMAEALRNNKIQAAFIIAPLAIVLRQQGVDVKVVYIGNRHESTMVVKKGIGATSLADLSGRTVAVPMRYSGHNLALLLQMEKQSLEGINIVEMNPPDMASALATGALDAYFVGEPFAAQTLQSGNADRLFYVEEIWPGFICNLMLVKNSFIKQHPKVVTQLVQSAARSGIWASGHPRQAARIASRYWGQPEDLVYYAMTTPAHRIVYDRFIPVQEELKYMATLMVRFGLADSDVVDGLVADSFARQADLEGIEDVRSIISHLKG